MEHRNNIGGQAHDDNTKSYPEQFDLHRYAQLVADGEIPFPTQLPADQREQLWIEVSRLRRARLVRYIARSTALDIYRSREH